MEEKHIEHTLSDESRFMPTSRRAAASSASQSSASQRQQATQQPAYNAQGGSEKAAGVETAPPPVADVGADSSSKLEPEQKTEPKVAGRHARFPKQGRQGKRGKRRFKFSRNHSNVDCASPADTPLGFAAPNTKEVQERLNKLTLGVTVAVAVTVFAVLFALWTAWSSYSQKVQLENDVKTVIVAAQDIKAGTTITSDMLAKKEIPEKYLGGGATSDASKLVNRSANVDISAQDAVTVKMVSGSSNTSSASAQLGKGEQAFALSVSAEDSVAGTVAQGDTVDVISVYKDKAQTLFSSKRVIALDALLSKRSSDYKTVTLALTPDEGKKLREYQGKGYRLTLALNPKSEKAGN